MSRVWESDPKASAVKNPGDLSVQYMNTEGVPTVKGIQKRKFKNSTDEEVNKSQKVTDIFSLPMLKNIVIVGTKQDLVYYGKSASKR